LIISCEGLSLVHATPVKRTSKKTKLSSLSIYSLLIHRLYLPDVVTVLQIMKVWLPVFALAPFARLHPGPTTSRPLDVPTNT